MQDRGMRSASANIIQTNQNFDGTHADFVPAFFDVTGDGSCFLYSIIYNAHTHPHPTSSDISISSEEIYGYDKEAAQRVRDEAVDSIMKEVDAYMKEYASIRAFQNEIGDLDKATRKYVRNEEARIKTDIIKNLSIDDFHMLTNQDGDIISAKIDDILAKLRLRKTWADSPMMSHIARSFPFNITIITVPNGWICGFHPGTHLSMYDIEANANDQARGYDQSINVMGHRTSLSDETIIVLFTGGHYMRVVFLNTVSHSLLNPMVIITVPTWQRHQWVDRVVRYWGFSPQNFATWRSNSICGFRGCQLQLGHDGGHN